MVSEDIYENTEWADCPNEANIRIRKFNDKQQVLISRAQTPQPGMATKCGPAMRAAIMERAKELGIWDMDPNNTERGTTNGVWVLSWGQDTGKIHFDSDCRGDNVIPTHEFLRLMENTKPPKKELTTEERLAEALNIVRQLLIWGEFPSVCGQTVQADAIASLKSIEP